MDYKIFFKNHVNKIKDENRYRNFVPIIRNSGQFPYAHHAETGEKIVLWCLNDYLGMSENKVVLEACVNSLNKYGVGSGGTRNIGGNSDSIVKLEQFLAKHHNKDKALLFTSGYVANQSTLSILAKIIPDLIFFSDELNHASIIEGIRNSRLEKHVYHHNDVNDLEKKLQSVDINRPKIIVFESVYSMNGIISPIKEICELARRYNVMTYIDEVHSVGIYGKGGSGLANMYDCDHKIDIIQATLSKAYGVIGGYIVGSESLIDAIRLSSAGFIFTTSLPPCLADAAIASVQYLINSDIERKIIQSNSKKVKLALEKVGIRFIKNDSHIITVGVGNPLLVEKIAKKLFAEYNIYVQHINFPTVPRGQERLRITPSSAHNDEMINHFVNSLKLVFEELSIIQPNQIK